VQAAEAVARRSYGKLVAFLGGGATRDVAGAEGRPCRRAFAAALVDWPGERKPGKNPEAWLMAGGRAAS